MLVHNLASFHPQNPFNNIVCAIRAFAMSIRKSSRTTKPPIKLTDYDVDDSQEAAATPQQISRAVTRELSQVESMIKHLSPTNAIAE